MYRKLMTRLVALFCLLFSFSFVYGEAVKGDFAIGVNYPGLGVKYFLSNRTALELKGQVAENIAVVGLRGYHYFKHENKFLPFAGYEADYITFQGDSSKGTGYAGEIFIGGGDFLNRKIFV